MTYVDNKAFPIPLTPAQKKRFKQTRVTGHLRKPSEGTQRGFTKPRLNNSFLGMPSVTISAAVAKDRVIMWHEVKSTWNGQRAAGMYSGPLIAALKRTWGNDKRHYMIVEDGDRKRNQSTKGTDAKAKHKIKAETLHITRLRTRMPITRPGVMKMGKFVAPWMAGKATRLRIRAGPNPRIA